MQSSTTDDLAQSAQQIEQARTEAQRRAAQVDKEEAEGAGQPGADENAAGFVKPAPAVEDEDADPVGDDDHA
ncbi:hypothetical protein [Variovorax sp. LT1R16]|uniref:hypothetical protein n=1 Tax=Variovorax sp. LT1R16 TaxID=3443728 RepID=UPI003F483142